ncbi:MAG: glycoside hydrolase family 44 protein [Terracidiphilus sp.]
MRLGRSGAAALLLSPLFLLAAACGGGNGGGTPPPTTYTLTVNSTTPASGVVVAVSPADANNQSDGTTSFLRTYASGTTVTLTAPAASGSSKFSAWGGCTAASAAKCTVNMTANTTVTASYTVSPITSVTVTPNPATATIGAQVQFTAKVAGNGSFDSTVTWSVIGPPGGALSAGSIDANGLYTTPYPAPASVTVVATSKADSTVSGSSTVTLTPPVIAAGPALTVDAGASTHAISPLIYGMNAFLLDPGTVAAGNITVARWGGDNTSRYDYKTNTSNAASDYYFQNSTGSYGMLPSGKFTDFATTAATLGFKALGTVPVQGWVANSDPSACSFTQAQFPGQTSYVGDCGSGVYADGSGGCTNAGGCNVYGNDTIAAITSIPAPAPAPPTPAGATQAWAKATWAGGWVSSLVDDKSIGPASASGVAIWDLDNEPAWWDAVHRDVHPNPSTYDEVTQGGIGTALAIKTIDPSAEVSGPVIDWWWNYFYSKKDIENGWNNGNPCWQPWSNPIDRQAHGGTPFLEYYLQQFAAAETTYGHRLLDYLTIHGYFAATFNGHGVGLTTAGDTAEQTARLNSTRVLWDSTYTDPNFPQPNYPTDPGYTSSCSAPLTPPRLVPRLKAWVAAAYPGTKTGIDEYNFGGLEHIDGALTQADILGIFGREGLDLATLWPTTNYTSQLPGTMAFAIYRNYDGKNSTFGDEALAASSADQARLAVYAAQRTSDGAVTLVVINKTYGDLTTTLSLANLKAPIGASAQVFTYSAANLAAIVQQPAVPLTAVGGSATSATVATTFPAQSITLLVVPN